MLTAVMTAVVVFAAAAATATAAAVAAAALAKAVAEIDLNICCSGPPVNESTFNVGFDDGEHKHMDLREVQGNSLVLGMACSMETQDNGLFWNVEPATRACAFTTAKHAGGGKPQKVMGMLLGRPCDKIAGASFYSEHHLSQVATDSFFEPVSSTTYTRHLARSRTANGGVTPGAAAGANRKGYHTFRRFDVEELLRKPDRAEAAFWPPGGIEAIDFGVIVAKNCLQLRRFLVLFADYHEQTKTHPHFFFASWTAWQRVQHDLGTPELTLST
eukprot:6193000-Pleurochrysis_carterae.AAC.1